LNMKVKTFTIERDAKRRYINSFCIIAFGKVLGVQIQNIHI